MMTKKTESTESEALFEQLCCDLKIPCTKISCTTDKTPDYDIILDGHTVITELKQLNSNEEDNEVYKRASSVGAAVVWPESDHRVRLKINKSSKQLKARSKGKLPTLLVIYDNGTSGGVDRTDIKTAMFGDEKVIVTRSSGGLTHVTGIHPGGNRKLTESSNTTISAIALMYVATSGTSVSLFHNHFAINRIDPSWFRDDRFRHFVLNDSSYDWHPV